MRTLKINNIILIILIVIFGVLVWRNVGLKNQNEIVPISNNPEINLPTSGINNESGTFIGHLYEVPKDTYYTGSPVIFFARPLFQKMAKENWQALASGGVIGNTFEDLKNSVNLFPKEITWHLYNEQKDVLTFAAQNPSEYKFWSDLGSAPVENIKLPDIKPNTNNFVGTRKEFLLSTNANVHFSTITERRLNDISQFESSVKDIPEVKNLYKLDGTKGNSAECGTVKLDKSAEIYTIDSSQIAIVNFSLKCGVSTDSSVLLGKKQNGEWKNIFSSASLDPNTKNVSGITFSLNSVGDFDGDGTKEYIFNLDGYNYDGYALYQEGMVKPVFFSWSYQ